MYLDLGVGKLVVSILQLWEIFAWKWAIEFPSGSGICFRSVLRYFLKSECGVVETVHTGKASGQERVGELGNNRPEAVRHEQIPSERRKNN